MLAVTLVPGGLAAPAAAVTTHGAVARLPGVGGSDWPMWGYDTQRTGFNPNETILSPATVSGLHHLWTFPFALQSDNAPVLASDVNVDGQGTDLIYAGDRSGTFYAVNASTGTMAW